MGKIYIKQLPQKMGGLTPTLLMKAYDSWVDPITGLTLSLSSLPQVQLMCLHACAAAEAVQAPKVRRRRVPPFSLYLYDVV